MKWVAKAELSSLHAIADKERGKLAMRRMLDPCELLTDRAAWEARSLARYDTAKTVVSTRNQQRFGAFTLDLLREVAALPTWSGNPPAVVREASAAAGFMPRLHGAFEQGARVARDSIVAVTPRRATSGRGYR